MPTPHSRPTPVPVPSTAPERAGHCEARLFGSFRLFAPDGSNVAPIGRKARALLAYLLSTGNDGATRDRLAGLLWSERGEDQARASLRQTLYEIRALTAGDAPLVAADRSRVQVVASRVTTDLDRIELLSERGDADALARFVGDAPEFLVDLDGVDPAFDEWLSIERTRQADRRRRALLAVAQRKLAVGDADSARQLADRLLACDAADEAAACVAMGACHGRGDRDGVRRVFACLQDALRRQVGVDVSTETAELHRRLMTDSTSRGPDPAEAPDVNAADRATVLGADVARDEPVPAPRPNVPPHFGPRTSWSRPRTRVYATVLCGLLLLGIGATTRWQPSPPETRSLLVGPFQASASDSTALALTTGLSADLARLIAGNDPKLQVIDAPRNSGAASPDAFHVVGEARSDAGLLHATLRLSREDGGPILWSRTFERPSGEVESLREEMASKLGDVAICALGRTNPGAAAFSENEIRLLLGACDQKQMPDYRETVKLLQQLVALRPDFAHGWALLAVFEQFVAIASPAEAAALAADAERSAQRALALDPNDSDAYYARALAMNGITQWEARMDVLMRGHALDPMNGRIDNAIGGSLQRVGRWQEAAAFHQQAVKVDPFSTAKIAGLIGVLGWGSEPQGAVAVLTDARRRFGKHRVITDADFRFNAMIGDPRRAQAILDDPTPGFALSPVRAALWSGIVADRATPSVANDARVDAAIDAAMRAQEVNVTLIVALLARRNRIDDAFAYIDRLRPDQEDDLDPYIFFTALGKPLRDDPRFMTVATRRGLTSIWKHTGRWPDFCEDRTLPYECRAEAERAESANPRPLTAMR